MIDIISPLTLFGAGDAGTPDIPIEFDPVGVAYPLIWFLGRRRRVGGGVGPVDPEDPNVSAAIRSGLLNADGVWTGGYWLYVPVRGYYRLSVRVGFLSATLTAPAVAGNVREFQARGFYSVFTSPAEDGSLIFSVQPYTGG